MTAITASPDLTAWQPRPVPAKAILPGTGVRLEPLNASRHAASLFQAAEGPGADPMLWEYLAYGPFGTEAAFAAWLRDREDLDDPRFFAVVDQQTGQAEGIVSYLRIRAADGSIEIGHIWFGAALQQTTKATEAIFLLARHAFDGLGYRRLEWKCNALNARSARAAERFGFVFEGVFRQDGVYKGRNRDTAWYSMLDSEWPVNKAAFEAWLAPDNFDAAGRQRRSLSTLRGGATVAS